MEDSYNIRTHEEAKINKKSSLGKTITKIALVIGTASIISYSLIKDKIFGNPRSKIRKGLFYATLAGIVLYKCQGEKVTDFYGSAKASITGAYKDFYELKKNMNEELNSIRIEYDSLSIENSELENKLIDYDKNDSALKIITENINNLYAEKDSLCVIVEKNAAKNDSLSELVKKYASENKKLIQFQDNNSKFQKEKESSVLQDEKIKSEPIEMAKPVYADKSDFSYLHPLKLVQINDSNGKYFFQAYAENFSKDDFIWTISTEASNLDEVTENYYGSRELTGVIAKYNMDRLAISERRFYPGVPVILIENDLVNSSNVYKGKMPRYSLFDSGISLECAVNYVYPEESKKIDVDSAIRMYNRMYGLEVDKQREKARITGSKYYSVLIPDFLKAWRAVAFKNENKNGK